jgi:RNA polymerase sigma-70 factor (ECF subfamily)
LPKESHSLHLRGAEGYGACWQEVPRLLVKQFADAPTLLTLEITEIPMTPPLTSFEDSVLIKLTLAGRAECFTVLMDRHLFAVRRRISSMVRSATDAEDLIQEVILKVWRHLSTFRSESSFRTWLTRVAINEALQSYRRERSKPPCEALGDFDALSSHGESPHQSFARIEMAQAVRSAVAELPAKYRQVLILRDLEERSAQETAQCLRSSIPAVKTRLFRARLMLLETLKRSAVRGFTGQGRRKPVGIPGLPVRRDDVISQY